MVLTKRQETAQRLCRELQAFGAAVTSVLPLEEGRHLRFWCSDYAKNELLQLLKDANYEVVFLGMSPQVDVKTYSMGLVNNFEVRLPADKQEVPAADRAIPRDEIGKGRGRDAEMQKTYEKFYGKQQKR
jgi:hypothetical protein